MHAHRLLPSLQPAARRLVVWLLIGLAPLQALAASVLATLGPAHVHVAPATLVVLEDVRRAAGPTTLAAPPRHVATAFGHFHAAQEPQRHHHAVGTAGVVVVGSDLVVHAGDADEPGTSAGFASAVALIPSLLVWVPPARSHAAASRAAWAPQTHHPEFPERPPRAG